MMLLLSLSWLALGAAGQTDSWTISWNRKVLLKATQENDSANHRSLRRSELTRNRYLEISFREGQSKNLKALRRSFLIFDENDREVWKKDSTRLARIDGATLLKLAEGHTTLKIYTIAVPSDPRLAARVRVRRVHLCSLELQ